MKRIAFTEINNYGHIAPYAIISKSVEFSIERGRVYITIRQEHFLEQGHDTETIQGRALFSDLTFNFNDNWFIGNLESIAKDVNKNYKEEFFINETPHCLSYKIITIDGKEYKYGNKKCMDSTYFDACEHVEGFCGYISVPSKLLKTVLSTKPFKKI